MRAFSTFTVLSTLVSSTVFARGSGDPDEEETVEQIPITVEQEAPRPQDDCRGYQTPERPASDATTDVPSNMTTPQRFGNQKKSIRSSS